MTVVLVGDGGSMDDVMNVTGRPNLTKAPVLERTRLPGAPAKRWLTDFGALC